jgi:hypothetical protein
MVPHNLQRYDTAGDYIDTPMGWRVFLSKLPNWRMEACLFIHEFVEMVTTRHNGISWEEIDRFDMDNPELDDPGACKKAPYHKEHMAAERIEKELCLLLGLKWEDYQKALDELTNCEEGK